MFKSSMCKKRIPTLFRFANIVPMIQRFTMGPFNVINHPKDCIQSMGWMALHYLIWWCLTSRTWKVIQNHLFPRAMVSISILNKQRVSLRCGLVIMFAHEAWTIVILKQTWLAFLWQRCRTSPMFPDCRIFATCGWTHTIKVEKMFATIWWATHLCCFSMFRISWDATQRSIPAAPILRKTPWATMSNDLRVVWPWAPRRSKNSRHSQLVVNRYSWDLFGFMVDI